MNSPFVRFPFILLLILIDSRNSLCAMKLISTEERKVLLRIEVLQERKLIIRVPGLDKRILERNSIRNLRINSY